MATEDTQPQSRDLPLREGQKSADSTESFDIVSTFNAILADDPDLTKPVAAIEALIALLGTARSTTVFETIELVKKHSELLKGAFVTNPVPLLAGIDLFQHNLTAWFKNQQEDAAGGSSATRPPSQYPSFEHVREHLLRNTRQFAQHAIDARDMVAEHGWRFIGENSTVMTHGASRAVIGILARAATESNKRHTLKGDEGAENDVRFRVIYIRDEARVAESDRVVAELRGYGIPVAEIPMAAVAHVLATPQAVNLVLLGAEAVTHDGGIISRMGTSQIAKLAAEIAPKRNVLVAAETHKFVRLLPLNTDMMGCNQTVLDFDSKGRGLPSDAVDYTPGSIIKELITENGVKQPGYVAKYLFDLYGSLAVHNA